MKANIYAIRDKFNGFGSPFVDQNDYSAQRGFSYGINGNGLMNYVPADFDLYRIGKFDSEKGIITALEVPELVCTGSSVFMKGDG